MQEVQKNVFHRSEYFRIFPTISEYFRTKTLFFNLNQWETLLPGTPACPGYSGSPLAAHSSGRGLLPLFVQSARGPSLCTVSGQHTMLIGTPLPAVGTVAGGPLTVCGEWARGRRLFHPPPGTDTKFHC